mgnify:CR=1 FL=1
MLLAMPPMLQYALPFAACFGATLAYHRFAADNEAVAAQRDPDYRPLTAKPSAPAGQHDAAVRAFALRLPAPVAWGDFSAALDALQSLWGERLLRVKGLVHVAGEVRPRVIQCVHHLRYPDAALPAWPQGARETRLVFIVRELDPAVVERAFACFCVPELVA